MNGARSNKHEIYITVKFIYALYKYSVLTTQRILCYSFKEDEVVNANREIIAVYCKKRAQYIVWTKFIVS